MRRDWDLIREVLIEIEGLYSHNGRNCEIRRGQPADSDAKAEQALLLYKSGLIEGIDASTFDGPAVIARGLTWTGDDLLQTMQSKPVWDRIKSIAQEKGIELTFDAVKALGKVAMGAVLAG